VRAKELRCAALLADAHATTMTVTAKRMATRHVLVKRLDIVQSLGAATVICTDKTGAPELL